jgi:hypothetical protein
MNTVHIKAYYNGNIRRFQSQTEWSVLLKQLQVLFQIDARLPLTVHYRDDENDLCRITTQLELDAAILPGSLLRLFLSLPEVLPPAPIQSSQFPCEGNNRKCWNPVARLERINKVLEQPDLSAEKRERMLQKKAWLEAKIQNRSSPTSAEPERPAWGPERCLAKLQHRLSQPNLPPHVIERLTLKKAMIEARRNQRQSSESCGPRARFAPHCRENCTAKKAKLEEKLNQNSENSENPCAKRLAWIQKRLEDPSLPEHKRQKLAFRKAAIEAQLNGKPHPEFGCNWGFFRPELRLAWINKKLETPNLPPQFQRRLLAKKAIIEQQLAVKNSENLPGAAPVPNWKEQRDAWFQMKLEWIQSRLQDSSLEQKKRDRLMAKKVAIEAKIEGANRS